MKLKEPTYKNHSIMLIDDNELDNFINTKIIEANHFAKNIYSNTSAKSAIEFLVNIIKMEDSAKSNFPQVIFVDINMPIIDGFQFVEYFYKNIKTNTINPKIVILTSSVYPEDKLKSQELSKNIIFLSKPLTKEMLNKI